MPPCAATEWLRTGWTFETMATSRPPGPTGPDSAATAARMPARPAPTIRMSWTFSRRPITRGSSIPYRAPTWQITVTMLTFQSDNPRHGPIPNVLASLRPGLYYSMCDLRGLKLNLSADRFVHRHLGPTDAAIKEMLTTISMQSLAARCYALAA